MVSLSKMENISCKTVSIKNEPSIDFDQITFIGKTSFPKNINHFSETYFRWLYQTGFGGKTTLIFAYHNNRIVGHASALWHEIFDTKTQKYHECIQLVDFFVLPSFRGLRTIRKMYQAISVFVEDNDLMVVTMPNKRSELLNRKFINLDTAFDLKIQFIPTFPSQSKKINDSANMGPNSTKEAAQLLHNWRPSFTGSHMPWDARKLINRLTRPDTFYHLHLTDTVLGITVKHQIKGINIALICGLLKNGTINVDRKDLAAIARHAAYVHKTPFVLYVGHNSDLTLSGINFPRRLRPSLMRLQGNKKLLDMNLSRFELIDFDFT